MKSEVKRFQGISIQKLTYKSSTKKRKLFEVSSICSELYGLMKSSPTQLDTEAHHSFVKHYYAQPLSKQCTLAQAVM